ncbi:MAG: hypothetical protein R3E83_00635 [Burkholderiaceae bacterium]
MAVDAKDGFIETAVTRPANESETQQFKKVVLDSRWRDRDPGRQGFASENEISEAKEAHDFIDSEPIITKPLDGYQTALNKLIGKVLQGRAVLRNTEATLPTAVELARPADSRVEAR